MGTCYRMCMLTRRTQLLLDDERYAHLERLAQQTHRSVGAVIREAIDRYLPSTAMTRAEALEHFLTAPLMDIGSDEEIRHELDTMYDDVG
ncbi:hypothetical protein BH18ACT7_BH18ACT7_09380 [soil metagenome]